METHFLLVLEVIYFHFLLLFPYLCLRLYLHLSIYPSLFLSVIVFVLLTTFLLTFISLNFYVIGELAFCIASPLILWIQRDLCEYWGDQWIIYPTFLSFHGLNLSICSILFAFILFIFHSSMKDQSTSLLSFYSIIPKKLVWFGHHILKKNTNKEDSDFENENRKNQLCTNGLYNYNN